MADKDKPTSSVTETHINAPGGHVTVLPQRPEIDTNILMVGRIMAAIAVMAVLALCVVIFYQIYVFATQSQAMLFIDLARWVPPDRQLPVSAYIIAGFGVHLLLILVAMLASVIAYKIISASGAQLDMVIPPQDYPLLAPLVTEGKSESIDLYVRLSSLSGFTGAFTQLGLTGLPLATILMTLVFTTLTIFNPDTFLDLTKLTLGAFLGSFVQRQVEQRRQVGGDRGKDEARVPSSSA